LNVLSGAPLLTTSATTNSPVGTYTITNSLGTLVATNYVVSLTNGTLTVTGAVLTATVNTGIKANNKVYDGTTAATISLTNVNLTGVISGDTVSLATNGYTATFASASVGTGIGVTVSGLSLTGPSAANYTLSQPVTLTANITAKALTIASAVPPPVITSIQLTNGVVTITWSSVTGGIYRAQYINSLNGGGWTDLSPDVTATGSTATQTNAVGNATQRYYRVVLLNPGLSANNKVYDGTTAAAINLSNVVLVGVVNGDSVSLVTNGYTANFASADVGTNIPVNVSGLALSGAGVGNYTLTQPAGLTANITAATLTYTATPAGMTYGTAVPALSGSVSGFVGTDTQGSATTGTLTFTTMATSFSGAGSYAINGSGLTANNGNYTFVQAAGNATALTISALPVNLTGTRVYDGTTAVAAGILSVGNKVGSDSVTMASGSGTLAGVAVGPEAITSFGTLTLGGASAGNYTLSGASGSVNITKAGLAVGGVAAQNKVYDGTTIAQLSGTATLNGQVSGDAVSLVTSNAIAAFANPNVGTSKPVTVSGYAITGADAGNYTLTQPAGLTANITGKVLTIMSVPAPVMTSIGLTNGVVTITWSSVTGGIYRVQYINSLNSNGWSDLSPDVTATGQTATQTNAIDSTPQRYYRIEVLNPGITANNKVYDGTTAATITSNNVVLVGVVIGDTVSMSTNGYTGNFANSYVGTAIPVTVSGLTLVGASAANYTLAPLVGLTANITPATLTVSAANKSKTYGLPNPPLTVSYSGFVNSEGTNVLAGAPSLSTSATINSPPGTYAITISAGTLSATNYNFTFVNGILTVIAPQLSIVRLNSAQVTLTWATIASQTYQLEYNTNLNTATWIPLGGPKVGTGNPIIITNGLGVSPQRYFRLSISP
jgi:hypothetical protein